MSGGGVRATRGARSEVGPSSRRDAGPGLGCAAGFLTYAATAGPAAFEAPERRAERGGLELSGAALATRCAGRTSTHPHANVPASAAASAAVLKYNDAVLASTTWGAL